MTPLSNDMTFPAIFAAGWQASGRELAAPREEPGFCELCGHHGPRAPWRPKQNWTAHDTHAYPGAGAACAGCLLLVDGRCPDPGASGRPMKWQSLTLASNGRTSAWATKADKRLIATWVSDPLMSVSIADQGKKHIAYRACVARPDRVTVSIDAQHVDVPRHEWLYLADQVQTAYRAGILKAVLATGRLDHRSHRLLTSTHAVDLQDLLDNYRSTTALRLAVWLAQHKETTDGVLPWTCHLADLRDGDGKRIAELVAARERRDRNAMRDALRRHPCLFMPRAGLNQRAPWKQVGRQCYPEWWEARCQVTPRLADWP